MYTNSVEQPWANHAPVYQQQSRMQQPMPMTTAMAAGGRTAPLLLPQYQSTVYSSMPSYSSNQTTTRGPLVSPLMPTSMRPAAYQADFTSGNMQQLSASSAMGTSNASMLQQPAISSGMIQASGSMLADAKMVSSNHGALAMQTGMTRQLPSAVNSSIAMQQQGLASMSSQRLVAPQQQQYITQSPLAAQQSVTQQSTAVDARRFAFSPQGQQSYTIVNQAPPQQEAHRFSQTVSGQQSMAGGIYYPQESMNLGGAMVSNQQMMEPTNSGAMVSNHQLMQQQHMQHSSHLMRSPAAQQPPQAPQQQPPQPTVLMARIRAPEVPKDYVPGTSGVEYIIAPAVPGARPTEFTTNPHIMSSSSVANKRVDQQQTIEQQTVQYAPTGSTAAPQMQMRFAQEASTVQQQPQHLQYSDYQGVPLQQPNFMPLQMQPPMLQRPHIAEEQPMVIEDIAAQQPLAAGDRLPPVHIDLHGVCVNLQEFFEDRSGIIFGLVGAYHPTDTDICIPKILDAMEHFEKLVDFVGCLVVNDPFVVKAWARKLGVTDQFTFIADSDAKFTKVLGMAHERAAEGLGLRSQRFAMVIGSRACIRWTAFEEDAYADNVLLHLPQFVRTPWKSFLVSVGYSKTPRSSADAADIEAENQIKEATVNALQDARDLLTQQRFCADSDWQLLLCDKLPDVYTPTKDNLINGLKWLVEGAQAGDVLCFYFAGDAKTVIHSNGEETIGIMPVDCDTASLITQDVIFDLLVPHVPANCRLTIILDVRSRLPVTVPLPYRYESEISIADGEFTEARIVSRPADEQRNPKFDTLKGEILVITLSGAQEVGFGTLSALLAAGKPEIPKCAEGEEPVPATMAYPPMSYAEQMERMQMQLAQWNFNQKSIEISSSIPLDLSGEFSLADVLPILH